MFNTWFCKCKDFYSSSCMHDPIMMEGTVYISLSTHSIASSKHSTKNQIAYPSGFGRSIFMSFKNIFEKFKLFLLFTLN